MRISIFFIILITFTFLTACNKKDDFNYPEGTVGISHITNYPVLSLKGSSYVAVEKGQTYTDQGVTAKEGNNDLQATTSGTVNTATPGVYVLTYTAVNKDGFSASVKRTVAVYSTDASAASNDLSGTYLRPATGASSVWTKIGPGVYKVVNPGGAVGASLTVVLFNPAGYTIFIPSQVSSDGSITSSSNEVYTNSNPPTYQMKILNATYGTGLRTFIKQ